MRTTLFFFALLAAQNLCGQIYLQNTPPVQQAQAATDCYTRALDNGNAALRRGEPREALQFFNDAKNCPDAAGNARRQAELDTRIARCEAQLGIKKVSENESKSFGEIVPSSSRKRTFSNELPIARRNYPAGHAFLQDTLEDCFRLMEAEADRAFNLRFWEDAAALYRAAKNCADADQNDRQRMSQKISDCRDAAENELFSKQQEAERQARHAIAANLADDAQELLRNTDRTLAFRLADFANQYVAPDDNPDCVQAMFDAWYYKPAEDSEHREDELYRPVFCYELADNLGENTQVKFERQKDGSQWLWAFVPKNGDLIAWEMPSMKLVQSYGTGEGSGYLGFDLSPDGGMLFWGNKYFDLRRGARSLRVDVPSVASWCFSARGDEFFFEDVQERKIYALSVRDAFAQQYARKGSKSSNVLSLPVVQREMVSGVPEGLLSMRYVHGKFWLGFRDRIEILTKTEWGKPWKKEKTLLFEGVTIPEFVEQGNLRLQFYPQEGLAILGYNGQTWSISFDSQANLIKTRAFESQTPLALSASTGRLACQYTGNYLHNGYWLLDAKTGDTLVRQRMPQYVDFDVMKGSYSPDARWVAATSFYGSIHVWALEDPATVWLKQLPRLPQSDPMLSPDGSRLFVAYADTLAMISTLASDAPETFWASNPPLVGASDQWVLLQISPDTAEARHLGNGRRLRFPLKNEGYPFLYSFDTKGKELLAYLSSWNKVEVRALKTGALLASKVFEGGFIGQLHFVPGTDDLLVVQHTSEGESEISQSSVKIWSPFRPSEKPRAFRLHAYPVRAMALTPQGSHAAFSDGSDIRVFDLKNIENEALKIRAAPNESVQAVAFQPNSRFLAAAYSTGKVVFWNFHTGQAALQLQAIPNEVNLAFGLVKIAAIGFSHSGNLLQMAVSDGRMVAYSLDPSYIRSVAQNEDRHLHSFDMEQIVRYNLEAALYYPGNFERLAESGDAPLVRSFFRHFRLQAVESNNISLVRDYCERAFYLYERLDGNNKELWRHDMRLMYEDYARKLLLRGNLGDAASVIKIIQREFDHEPVLLNAHLALLNRNFPMASSLYSKYLLTQGDDIPASPARTWIFNEVEKELMQLRDYELVDSAQISCFCGTVRLSGGFSVLCPLGDAYPSNFLSAVDRFRWEISRKRTSADNTLRNTTKTRLLDEAHQKARELVRLNPSAGAAWLETVTLELANAHRKWGVFEQNSPEALPRFERAVQLLTEIGPFKKISDTSRLSLLTSTRLAWGKRLLSGGQSTEAFDQLNLGLASARQLFDAANESDTSLLRVYYDHLFGPLYEHIGSAILLEGKTAEARQAYELAGDFYMTYGLNTLYLANVSVLENDETEAWIQYGGITDASETAEALYWIGRLAQQFPAKRAPLEAFGQNLRTTLAQKNPRLVNEETYYWLAKLNADGYAAQSRWDSAIVWSTKAMESAKRCADQAKNDDYWKNNWLNEHINLPYFLLLGRWNQPAALDECIRIVADAEGYLAQQDSTEFYYSNRELLKTNLAHAYVLRNQPGDQERAVELYQQFLQSYADPRGFDNLDILQKDVRDLKRVGAPWPALPMLEGPVEEER